MKKYHGKCGELNERKYHSMLWAPQLAGPAHGALLNVTDEIGLNGIKRLVGTCVLCNKRLYIKRDNPHAAACNIL